MKFFVTGVGGQLGHDVMNELSSRGHEGVGSDIAPSYSGIADGTPVTTMPYVQLDITDKEAVKRVIESVKPDAVIHCAAWTAGDMAEDDDKIAKVRAIRQNTPIGAIFLITMVISIMTSLNWLKKFATTEPLVPSFASMIPTNWANTMIGSISPFAMD